MAQWYNPPFTAGKNSMSTYQVIRNKAGAVVAHGKNQDTAEGIAKALNTLDRLGYSTDSDAIGT